MAKQWAKIGRDVKDSDRMTALLAKNPLAEALFWRIKAWADDFGRYVGEPEQIAAGICPRNVITGSVKLSKLKTALQDMEASGVVRFYIADDGKKYLEIIDYLNHAHDKWANVGRPEYPAPPGWQPPSDLVDFLQKNAKSQNVSADRYGVTKDNWPIGIEYPFDTHSIPIEYPGGRVSNTLVDTLGHDSDVDSDVDLDSDKEGERANADAPAPTATPAEIETLPEVDPNDFAHMEACNDPLTGALRSHFRSRPPQFAQDYAQAIRQQLDVPGCDMQVGYVVAQVKGLAGKVNGPRPGKEHSERFGAEAYLERLTRERAPQTPRGRASPGDVEAKVVAAGESLARPPELQSREPTEEERRSEHEEGMRSLQEAREALKRHGRLAVNQ